MAAMPVAGIADTRSHRQMFGDNVAISGGQFYQANDIYVAPSAFHNLSQRVDPPRCHPNTRIEILQAIHNWIMQYAQDRESWILWLSGAAGAGKSAIMQSIVKQILLHYHSIVSVAGFFFYRGDSTRNIIDSVIPTLAYQLIQQVLQTSDDVLTTIANNPFIFKQSLEAQLRELIITLRNTAPN
ncbi:hypothetical protein BDN70DRAFT_923758 [Pholiota conissans]|uniref:Nephrocystin 3-like N-terminal domain-containing protein n=1 Tax=Pholiota conissans TaxID=109636 RepID=A0A9P5YU07_9AGAR|nr:hypothetical protein BDN70DRAFT_923758 [Pholiota conissans]